MKKHNIRLIYGLSILIFVIFALMFFKIGPRDLLITLITFVFSALFFSLSYLHVLKQNMQQAKNHLMIALVIFCIAIVMIVFML